MSAPGGDEPTQDEPAIYETSEYDVEPTSRNRDVAELLGRAARADRRDPAAGGPTAQQIRQFAARMSKTPAHRWEIDHDSHAVNPEGSLSPPTAEEALAQSSPASRREVIDSMQQRIDSLHASLGGDLRPAEQLVVRVNQISEELDAAQPPRSGFDLSLLREPGYSQQPTQTQHG